MLGGLESARSIVHLAEMFVLADRAGPAARPGARGRAHAAHARARGRSRDRAGPAQPQPRSPSTT